MSAQDVDGGLQLPRAARRARVVEGHDDVRFGRGPDALLDEIPRRQVVRQADDGVVVAERRPEQGRGGQGSGHARDDLDLDGGPQLEDERGHGEHARVAAAHERDASAGLGLGDGLLGPHQLVSDRRAHGLLPWAHVGTGLLDVGPVADDDIGTTDGGGRGRR